VSSKPLLVDPEFSGRTGLIARELACDELLLLEAETRPEAEILRFWLPSETGVVAGYSNQPAREINLAACGESKIPVYRRMSGGGTVVQGPGCLNLTVIAPIQFRPEYSTAGGTSRAIALRMIDALRPLLPGRTLALGGDGDLAMDGRKVLGSAQKRLVRCFLFHASLLLDMDIELITQLLPPPSKEPPYRAGRNHRDFLTNLHLPAETVITAIAGAWGPAVSRPYPDAAAVNRLAAEKYRPLALP
jgi:lipoate---protein ligase